MITIRVEKPEDVGKIRLVNEQAFESPAEADIVDALRRRGAIILSIVAEVDGDIVGHILFTPVTIETAESKFYALAIGPMAVAPDYQNKGIGSELVRKGLEECLNRGYDVVIVLGHPEFYPRLGFKPASPYGIKCEFEVPDEVFMVAQLKEGALSGISGTVEYQPEFSEV